MRFPSAARARFWRNYPVDNIAIATGRESGIFVVEVDPHHGDDVAELERRYGALPPTWTVRSGRGGSHFYFRYPPTGSIPNSSGKLAPGVDVRGDHGVAVAVGSLHKSGNFYQWVEGRAPGQLPLASLEAVS